MTDNREASSSRHNPVQVHALHISNEQGDALFASKDPLQVMRAILEAAGHRDVECSECGSEFCETAMHEVEAGVHAHSQDLSYRFVCPYCWQKESQVP